MHLDEGAADDCRLIAETHAGGDSMTLYTQGASGAGSPTWGIGLDADNDYLSIGFEDTGYDSFSLTGDNLFTITTDGNVGVGTISPDVELDVDGEIRAADGILFGTDTAAANALDDYEEGTWTPTDNSGAGLTFTGVVATYVKVGQLVTVAFALTFPGSSASALNSFGGLPFTTMTTSNTMWGGFITYTDFGEDLGFITTSNGTTFTGYTSEPLQPNNTAMVSKSFRANSCV